MSSGGAVAPSAGGGNARGDQQQATDWKRTILKGLAIYFFINTATQLLAPKPPQSAKTGDATASRPAQEPPAWLQKLGAPAGPPPVLTPPLLRVPKNASSQPLWPSTSELDFYVFLSHSAAPSVEDIGTQLSPLAPGSHRAPALDQVISFDLYPTLHDSYAAPGQHTVVTSIREGALPIIKFGSLALNDTRLNAGLVADINIATPPGVMYNNGSLWADVVAVGSGMDVRTTEHKARMRKLLTRLYPARKHREGRRLLGSEAGKDSSEEHDEDLMTGEDGVLRNETSSKQIITYWHRNLTLALPHQDVTPGIQVGAIPPPLLQHVHLATNPDGSVMHSQTVDGRVDETRMWNYPVIFANTFWDLREDMNPINATTPVLPLHISLYSTSWFKFQLLAAMSDSFEKQPGMASGEIDIIKHTLQNTSPWYLALTLIVTLTHALFEYLAFAGEVQFYRKKENFVGVSLGSIMTNIVTQTIILLYLFDSSEETSYMILGSQAVGVVIEAWKLTKAVTVTLVRSPPGSRLPYRLEVRDKYVPTPDDLKTKEYDRQAFKLVSYFTGPLLVGYTIYSAYYETHRGWWSFVIGTLTSFVYAFGFIALMPQLIINYRLKSVAGMPPKTLVYKILNTFVDDLFAWGIVKMPILHRLATLRDDVVFFIYLYQWWAYGVDKKRVNEFGQKLDDGETDEGEKARDRRAIESKAETKKDQ